MKNALFAVLLIVAALSARAQDLDKPLLLVASHELKGPYHHTALLVVPLHDRHVGFILNRATVIGVGQTSTTSRTTTDEEGTQTIEEVPKTILTLALTQKESEKLIWADRFGELNVGLLSDKTKTRDEKGTDRKMVVPDAPAMPTA